MAGASKRRQEIVSKVDREKAYEVNAALGLVKELATAKFKESIDISVNLGVRTRVNQIRLFVVLRSTAPWRLGKNGTSSCVC